MFEMVVRASRKVLTRAGYDLYLPTPVERTRVRSFWEDWLSHNPLLFAQIYQQNRAVLSQVANWTEGADMERSLWRYGVPEAWETSRQGLGATGLNEIETEVTYSDLLAFIGRSLGESVRYLEIGVSVGKNFLQLAHQFTEEEMVGLDIEDINPRLARSFASVETVWRSDGEHPVPAFGRTANIRFSHQRIERAGAAPALYVQADELAAETWARLRGRTFNLVLSDGVHSPEALRTEVDFLLGNDLLPAEGPFVMYWDDLVDLPMQQAFVDNAERLTARFGPDSRFGLHWIHGTYANKRLNGVFVSGHPLAREATASQSQARPG